MVTAKEPTPKAIPLTAQEWRLVGWILVAAVALRLALSLLAYTNFIDDAYIYMRYAENLVQGHGLNYNPPDRVLAFTSYTFMSLIAGASLLLPGVSSSTILMVTNLLLFSVFLIVLAALLRPLSGLRLAALLFATFYFPYVDSSVNGMETILFSLLITSTLLTFQQQRYATSLFFATAAGLTRPEGVLLFGIVAFATMPKLGVKRYLQTAMACAALLLAYLVPLYLYYGWIVPQSMMAKSALVTATSWGGIPSTLYRKALLLGSALSDMQFSSAPQSAQTLGTVLFGLTTLVFVWGLLRARRAAPSFFLAAMFYLSALAFYQAGRPVRIFSWYTMPTSICFFLVVFYGLEQLAARRAANPTGRLLPVVVLMFCAGSIVYGLPQRLDRIEEHVGRLNKLGLTLKEAYPEAQSAVISDIGIFGYVTEWHIVDLAGLVSPETLEAAEDGEKVTLFDIFEQTKPDILCLKNDPRGRLGLNESFVRHRSFRNNAELAQFERTYEEVDFGEGHFAIFARRSLR